MRIVESSVYSKWFRGLKDRVTKARIDRRIKRAARGDYGDVKPVGENVSELRLQHFDGVNAMWEYGSMEMCELTN